jgi:S1-C subfamily serine protease
MWRKMILGVILSLGFAVGYTTHSLVEGKSPDASVFGSIEYQEHVRSASVEIGVKTARGTQRFGTGIVLSVPWDKGPGSYVLTARHVVEGEGLKLIVVYWGSDGPPIELDAQVVYLSPKSDLALLFIPAIDLPGIEIELSESRKGDPLIMTGYPVGVNGPVNSYGFYVRDDGEMYLISSSIWYGFSGSGVINVRTGKIIGIAVQLVKPAGWGYRADGARIVSGASVRGFLEAYSSQER